MNTYRIEIESWIGCTRGTNGYIFEGLKAETVEVKGYRLARATAIQAKHKLGAFSSVILRGANGHGFVITESGVKRHGR